MRLVAGNHKGRPLQAPKGRDTRPTSDRTRAAVFNILEHGVDDFELRHAVVLDVFAGTGALGLEALSRGAKHATFMESGRDALQCLHNNINLLKEEAHTTVLKADATKPRPALAPCDLVFLDPPYGKDLLPKALTALVKQGWITSETLCVAEEAVGEEIKLPQYFSQIDHRTYGAAQIIFARFTT